ncbi:MAG: ABC transporter ATP-binding protein [Vulcanimicrobiota bacterium]
MTASLTINWLRQIDSKEETVLMQTLFRLLKYIRKYWWCIAVAGVCTLGVNAMTLLQPQLIRYIMDNVILSKAQSSLKSLNIVILGFLALIVAKGIFSYLQGYLLPHGVNQAVRDMRDDIFHHLQFLPLRTIEKYRTGDLMVRITNDTDNIGNVLGLGLINFLNDIIVLIGGLALMIYMDWQMTLMILLLSPLVAFAVYRFGQYVEHAVKINQQQVSRIYSTIEESINGIRIIKSFVREKFEIERFKKQNQELFNVIMKVIQFKVTQAPVVEFLGALGVAVAVWYGGYQVINGKFSIGDIFAFWGYMVMATNPLNRISQTYSTIRGCIVSAGRVFELLDLEWEESDRSDAVEMPPIHGRIRYENVSFHYTPETPVLKNLSFEIEAGQVLALVGLSGGGKTTTVNLLARFYGPDEGAIYVDDMDISKVKLYSLRSQMAVVPQETMLFSGTIRDNICFGKVDATDEEVIQAATTAYAHDFIDKFSDGYATSVGERGTSLSGGQRQRIALARAILKNPRLLILDEATSSVDALSEELIQKGLENLLKDRTTIIIAHRISTIRKAHKILVIDKGQVAESGTHEELLEQKGLYTSLYQSYFMQEES